MAGGGQAGVPYVLRATVTTGIAPLGGRMAQLPGFINFLKIRADINPCRLYFTEADYLADTNYVLVPEPAAATPNGEWSGPVETSPGDRANLWLRGDGGPSTVELVAFLRRG